MNRRQLELQIRAVQITLRFERRRQDVATMTMLRERGRALLDGIADHVAAYPDLQSAFDDAMSEIQASAPERTLNDTG